MADWQWVLFISYMTAMGLLIIALHHPSFRRAMKYLGGPDPDYPRPPLRPGEFLVRDGCATFSKGAMGTGIAGPILLTNQRILWYDDRAYVQWPFKRISHEVPLANIETVDKSWWTEHLFGGMRLRIRLASGKDHCLLVDGIDEWIRIMRLTIELTHSSAGPA